jgi:hypothetical protein
MQNADINNNYSTIEMVPVPIPVAKFYKMIASPDQKIYST